MAFDINEFKQNGLVYSGARPSKFNVILTAPPGVSLDTASQKKFTFTCHSASLPESALSEIEVSYFGRKIKKPGDRTFSDWDVSVYNDEDFGVRSLFEAWSNAINSMQSNIMQSGLSTATSVNASGSAVYNEAYKTDLVVQQFSKDGEVIRSYNIIGAWPMTIGKINLNWDAANSIEEFDVSFAYDYWLPITESSSKTAGGSNPYLGQATSGAPTN